MTVASNIRPTSNDLVMTAKELKDLFLFGIDLTGDDGAPFPQGMYEFYIRSAQNWLEKELGGIVLCKKTIEDERHDYYLNDYMTFNFIKLFRYPAKDVSAVAFEFPGSNNILNFDPSWFRIESNASQVNLLPVNGTISQIILAQSGQYLPMLSAGHGYLPHMLRVSYTAGFEKKEIPANLLEVIGMKASMGPLNIAGDLIAGAGIASKSIGLDGLSQSIATTASATNAGYGARILQYNKEIQDRMKGLREYYCGINMVVA